jgi:hypothetical protein
LFDIEHRGAVVGGGERQGAEVMLPEVTVGFSQEKDFARVLGLEIAHEVGDAALAGGFEDQMDVIGH